MSFYRPHDRVYSPHGERSMTRQEFKEECDIYEILAQFRDTGVIRRVQTAQPTFGDLPDDIDFQQSVNTVLQAQQAFASLPSNVRDFYGNNPERFLAAMYDSSQRDQLERFGLVTPKPKPEPEAKPE